MMRYWNSPSAVPYKDELIDILERTRFGSYPWTPYELLIRTLAERYGIERPASLSQASFQLRWFQEEGVLPRDVPLAPLGVLARD